jgi:hypothetical protein
MPFEVCYVNVHVICNVIMVYVMFNTLLDFPQNPIILLFNVGMQENSLFIFSHFRNLLELNYLGGGPSGHILEDEEDQTNTDSR